MYWTTAIVEGGWATAIEHVNSNVNLPLFIPKPQFTFPLECSGIKSSSLAGNVHVFWTSFQWVFIFGPLYRQTRNDKIWTNNYPQF